MRKLKGYCLIAFCFFVFNLDAQTGLQAEIDTLLKIYDIKDSPGLAIRVIKDDTLLYSRGLGIANLDYNIKNTDSTIFSLASISKQFTAAAIWSLINDGKLSLDHTLIDFFPDFPVYDSPIKIRHLLNHTSGIRNYHSIMYLSGFDYDKTYYDNTTVLNLAKRQKNLNNQPGEKIIYSNTNYNILALIVEQLSGQNLNDYLKAKVLLPIGMKHTFVRVSHGNIIKNRAIGYQKIKGDFVYNTTNQLSYGSGSMGSNLNDMSIWVKMLNEEIPAFKKLAQFLKTTEVLTNGQNANYARGLMVDNYKGFETFSHSGFGFGGQTQLITVPDENIGVIILANLQSINPTPISYQILDLLLIPKQKEAEKIANEVLFKPQNLNQFIGDYKEVNSDMTMRITIENDTLKALGSMGKTPISLTQNDKNRFVRSNAHNVKYDFTKTLQHDMTISFGGTPFYFKRAKLLDKNPSNLNDFAGYYFSEELDTTYYFFIEDNFLKLSYSNNNNITLYPIQVNEFGNRNRTLYHFVKSNDNKVTEMLLSCDGQVSNIEFIKDQTQY